jgi:outer membrane protein OmpA-like peptidoglycan-associated protein
MKKKIITGFLITFLFQQYNQAQIETYSVTLTQFSTKKYDEFSPVYYKNGIVFCTNRSPNLFLNYLSSQNNKQYKIYYVEKTGQLRWKNAKIFSKKLSSRLNDGPATFSSHGDTIYYSRNIDVTGKISNLSSKRNKLGIFSAVLVDEKWTKVREFRFNNEMYNITSPYLSPDGGKIYFASDKPGGYGGTDIYYSQWEGDYWTSPMNLGPVINTSGNESYPFLSPSGDLFFSSDRQPGLGGTDIYFSQFSDTCWYTPVRLDPPVNSQFDDFGIITDTLMKEGYFSSRRNKSVDIYQFRTNIPQIFYSSLQKENQYCFIFKDYGSIVVDTSNLQYKWNFGDRKSSVKPATNHCYEGPGDYTVNLDIVERGTGKLFFSKLSYNLEIMDYEQPYINSSDVAFIGDNIEFDGFKSYLPGFDILTYSWDFGDGNRSSGGSVKHSYLKNGEYIVNMGLTLKSGSTGNIKRTGISKKILVLNDLKENASILAKSKFPKTTLTDITNFDNVKIKSQYSAETEFQKDAVFAVELISSKNKNGLNSSIFRKVPKKYRIREKFDSVTGTYSYVVDQQMNLMATYPAYREMLTLGFKDVQIKMYVLKEQSEKDLHNLIRINGAYADSYFDTSERLTSKAYIMLDQIVKLLNKYTSMKLEIAVHTDNTGASENSLLISQRQSQDFVKYLIMRGINTKRLVATGFGGSKPIASNSLEKDRKLNRRIDFVIIN